MNDFLKTANSWWMYLLGASVVIFILAGSIFFIFRAYKTGKELNMDKKILNRTIINSALFTIIPSISILIGVIALSGTLGVPLPWIRLTVIGALHYEGAAAEAAYNDLNILMMNNQTFVTIAFVMTLGILSGPLYCLFGFKAYDKKILSKAKVSEDEVSTVSDALTKKSFGPILFNAAFIAMICAFLSVDIAKLFIGDAKSTLNNYTPVIVIITSFAFMALFDFIDKKLKTKWISSFSLGLSMIMGMIVAIILG